MARLWSSLVTKSRYRVKSVATAESFVYADPSADPFDVWSDDWVGPRKRAHSSLCEPKASWRASRACSASCRSELCRDFAVTKESWSRSF